MSNIFKERNDIIINKVFNFRRIFDHAIKETNPTWFDVWTNSEKEILRSMGGNPSIEKARKLFSEYKYLCIYHWKHQTQFNGVILYAF